MSDIKKNQVLKAFVFCLVLISMGTFCFSYYYFNGSTGGYEQNTQPPGIQDQISMEILVIDGAGYFLQAQAKVQTILNMLELQDINSIDYIKINQLVKSSLTDIMNARINFEELIKIAEETTYNIEVIGQLNRFNYESFLREYNLNSIIFGIVRDYLVRGDITGTFKHAYSNFNAIEQLLLNIQSSVAENRMPELKDCWSLNELCAEETLFGSYIARIFNAIK